jgi:hypothetical protein
MDFLFFNKLWLYRAFFFQLAGMIQLDPHGSGTKFGIEFT